MKTHFMSILLLPLFLNSCASDPATNAALETAISSMIASNGNNYSTSGLSASKSVYSTPTTTAYKYTPEYQKELSNLSNGIASMGANISPSTASIISDAISSTGNLPANSSFFNKNTNNNMMQNYLMLEQAKMRPVDLSSSVDTSSYCHNYGYDGTWDPVTKQCHWW